MPTSDEILTAWLLAIAAYLTYSIARACRNPTKTHRWAWECTTCGLRYDSAGLLVRHIDLNHKENL